MSPLGFCWGAKSARTPRNRFNFPKTLHPRALRALGLFVPTEEYVPVIYNESPIRIRKFDTDSSPATPDSSPATLNYSPTTPNYSPTSM